LIICDSQKGAKAAEETLKVVNPIISFIPNATTHRRKRILLQLCSNSGDPETVHGGEDQSYEST
jgi:hypothetical protein